MAGFEITAYVLAGGGSRRMGVDKLFLRINGQSLLERALEICQNSFSTVKILAMDSARFDSLDYQVVKDSQLARGPMAGIIAALEDCDSEKCFVVAVDLYDLNSDLINSIVNQYEGQQYLGLMEAKEIQPLCGIYHKSALELLYKCARDNDYGMVKAVKKLNYRGINLPDGQWRNLNSLSDLAMGGRND